MKCTECKWSKEMPMETGEGKTHPTFKTIECHRKLPLKMARIEENYLVVLWPRVQADDFCGLYEKKKE